MSNKINIEELKTMIANQTRDMGLNDILDNTIIEKIKNKIMNVYNHDYAKKSMPEIIPETTLPTPLNQAEQGMFPNNDFEDESSTIELTGRTDFASVESGLDNQDFTQQPGQNIDAGTTGNISAYTPELPSFLDKIEPAKIIVFSQNELSEGGENLTNKPFRTFEDPDIKKSMNDVWVDKGQRKADVFMAKLEKIGELEFDYTNGTTQFIEKRFEPDFEAQAKYKENPYMSGVEIAAPGLLNISGQPNVVAQIATSIDLEKAVKDIVMGILRDQLLSNTEKAVNSNIINPPTHQMGSFANESLSIKMIDLVNEYNKIDTPSRLKEAIEKNDKSYLIQENEEVQEWKDNGKLYYTPVNKISTKKCYIKS